MTRVLGLSRLACSVLLVASLLAACDSGARRDLTFEFAGATVDGQCNVDFVSMNACTSVEVYRVVEGRREPVRLFRLDDAVRDETTGAFRLRLEGDEIRFDAEEITAEDVLDLEFRVFDGAGQPAYGATVEDVSLAAGGELTVRLYPFRRWACPGPVDQTTNDRPDPRALHAAVRLSDGNVLLFGGVSGVVSTTSVLMGRPGARAQPSVQLYDASAHRFFDVSATGLDGDAGFERVLFEHYYLGAETVEGRVLHRIRVIGGVEPDGDAAVVSLDNTGLLPVSTGTAFGSPLVPSGVPGRPVDLLFDPQARSVSVVDAASPEPVVRGALTTRSAFLEDAAGPRGALVVVGLDATGLRQPSASAYVLGPNGNPIAGSSRGLLRPRLGATVEPLADLDAFLVWGGNVKELSGDLRADAGEIQTFEGSETSAVAVSAAGDLWPTAFHTSTRVPGFDRVFLVAGGYQIGPSGGGDDRVLSLVEPSAPPLTVLEVTGDRSVVPRPVEEGAYIRTAFHTATALEDGDILLTGGARVVGDGSDRFVPVDQAGLVRGFAYAPLTHGPADAPSPLATARWGHSATPLSGRRVLVVGGFAPYEPPMGGDDWPGLEVRATASAELLYTVEAPAPLAPGQCGMDDPEPPDGGVSGADASLPPVPDAGPPDAGPADAGPLDASVPADGATPPSDGG